MKVTLIAAIGLNNELGKDNQLLWHLPSDLKRFKQVTTGHCIIMGRKTFESIGKALPNRTTIVITRDTSRNIEGVIFVAGLKEAFVEARKKNESHCFIIGGADIYKQALPYADTLDITHVQATFEADVFFPKIDETIFNKTQVTDVPADEKNNYAYSFTSYENTSKKNKALFLDRDGVLNKEIGGYITNTSLFQINDSILPFLKQKMQEGYLLIVITNQGAINKGLVTPETLSEIHALLRSEYELHGIAFEEIYYCPHHSDLSNCLCRKPKSLLIEKAIARFNININESVLIGDHERDRRCAEGAGVLGIVIASNDTAHLAISN